MAAALFLVERDLQPGDNDLRDGISAVLINTDDAQSSADIRQAAVDAVNAALPSDDPNSPKLPDGYFQTDTNVGTPAGVLGTDGDFLCYEAEVTSVRT